MHKILITGGAGYLGSHISINALKKGYKIIVMDSFVNSSRDIFKNFYKVIDNEILENNFEIISGDIRNQILLNEIFDRNIKKGEQITSVIHCAGLKSITSSLIKPEDFWDINVFGTVNLLKTMKYFECQNLIFSSSATVYDPSREKKLDENCEIKPSNPYGTTKFVTEKFLEDIYSSAKNKWKILNLRYFNPIGADPDGIIGESPKIEKNNIFPLILDVASKKLEKLTIFGNDWETVDGTPVRDYIHVHDLAKSHLKGLEYLDNKPAGFLNLNIGTGCGTTVLELIRTFEKTNNLKIPFEFGERRKGDFGYVVADNSLAKATLSWKPKKDLRDMCKDGWNWILKSNT